MSRLCVLDRLLVLKKPFDVIEVLQLANTLTAKWDAARQAESKMNDLEIAVQERTHQIWQANEMLKTEIKERKQLEAQLIQSGKLASIGQLAAGIAHEINNPIAFVFSNFNTLETYFKNLIEMLNACEIAEQNVNSADLIAELEEVRERAELDFLKQDIPALMLESKDGLTRVSKIIQDLKDFSRCDTDQTWEWADLHLGIDSTINIIANELKYAADVIKEYGHLPKVECLPSQLNQVFMNLMVNAAHASGPRRGHITIRTGTQGDEVWIEIEDDGSGIPVDILPRIFDPFFTTKAIGKGTGLGLSMSYGIIQRHRGRIDVRTKFGEGTTFRVVLPIKHAKEV